MAAFAEYQPEWADHKVASFPVNREEKKPMITNPQKVGLKGSCALVAKFPNAEALGFWAGPHNRLTVLDVDCKGVEGERLLGDLETKHGRSKLIVRTSGGKFHAYYRNNGERRKCRYEGNDGIPVDLLGKGLVVAPPSNMVKGNYEIIHGSMDDLDDLTVLCNLPSSYYENFNDNKLNKQSKPNVVDSNGIIREGERNKELFYFCMETVRDTPEFDKLLSLAKDFSSERMDKPLSEVEIFTVASNAWRYEQSGKNYVGMKVSETVEFFLATTNPDANALYSVLRLYHKNRTEFLVANAMMEKFGWQWRRFSGAKKFLIEHGFLIENSPATNKAPAIYGWGKPRIPTDFEGLGLMGERREVEV